MVGNVFLSIFLIQQFPVYGAAIGTCVSFVIGNTILSNIYYHKKVGINMFKYCKKLFKGIAIVWLISMLIGVAIYFIPGSTWWHLILRCGLYIIVYGILVILMGVNKEEKEIINSVIKRLKNKKGGKKNVE